MAVVLNEYVEGRKTRARKAYGKFEDARRFGQVRPATVFELNITDLRQYIEQHKV